MGYERLATVRDATRWDQSSLGACDRHALGVAIPLSHPSNIYHATWHAVPSWEGWRGRNRSGGAAAPPVFLPLVFSSASLGRARSARPRARQVRSARCTRAAISSSRRWAPKRARGHVMRSGLGRRLRRRRTRKYVANPPTGSAASWSEARVAPCSRWRARSAAIGSRARARQGSAATSAGSERRRTRTSLSMLRRIASAAVGETSYPDRSSMAPAHATLRSESLSSLARTPFGDGPIGTAPDAFAVYVWVISRNFLTA